MFGQSSQSVVGHYLVVVPKHFQIYFMNKKNLTEYLLHLLVYTALFQILLSWFQYTI